MVSRLLLRLDAAVSSAKDDVTADRYRAEIASHLARLGRQDEARSILRHLHQRYDAQPHPEISAWLNLAEGLAVLFSDMGAGAHDKFQRSQALSKACGIPEVHARSAAWLAHIHFTKHQFDRMTGHLEEALKAVRPDDSSTLSRICLVVGQAIHLADRDEMASGWYERARVHALKDGDELTLAAVNFNQFSFRAVNIRNAELGRMDDRIRPDYALTGAESAQNYDAHIGATNLGTLAPLLKAQALVQRDQVDAALALYEVNVVPSAQHGLARLHCWYLADMAWCYAMKGLGDRAREAASHAAAAVTSDTHVDDRAATHSRLAQTYRALGDEGSFECQSDLARPLWERFRRLQENIEGMLENIAASYLLMEKRETT